MLARSIAAGVALFILPSDADSKSGGHMLHKPDVTATLARYLVATRWEEIPREVRHQAKRSFINLFAVALAGCRAEPVEIALSSLHEFSGGKQATVIGRVERIDALAASFLNAAAANVHDFCDTHLRTAL